jgi:transcription antitermination factor NusG
MPSVAERAELYPERRPQIGSTILYNAEFPWYVIRLRSNFEKGATAYLKEKGYSAFLPSYRALRKWSDRVKEVEVPLFPGYTFCRFDPHYKLPILMCPGVISILESADGPIPVPEKEIAAVKAMLESGIRFGACPFLQQGQPVIVERGPLKGTEGVVVRTKGAYRLVVSVFLLQRSISAEIDRDSVRALPTVTTPVGLRLSPAHA